jgi:Protein of unknown function (DUF1217)
MMGLVTSYRQLTNNSAASLKRIADQPDTSRDVAYYKANIGSIKSLDQFLGDQRLYSFAMRAFGLKDMIYAKAFMKKALSEGTDTAGAFSLKLADPRFRDFVNAFNFKRYGSATTSFDRTQQGTIDKYVSNLLEEQAGSQNEGLRLALHFKKRAPEVASVFGLLGEAPLYNVVRTALSLPAALSSIDIDKQAQIIGSKLNINDFKDSVKLDSFITRFLSLYEMQNGAAGAASPTVSLLTSSGGGVDMNTLLSLQTIKRFGS